jgi:hypothetical protein
MNVMLKKKSYASAKCNFALRSLTGSGTGFALNYFRRGCIILLIFAAGCRYTVGQMGGTK